MLTLYMYRNLSVFIKDTSRVQSIDRIDVKLKDHRNNTYVYIVSSRPMYSFVGARCIPNYIHT